MGKPHVAEVTEWQPADLFRRHVAGQSSSPVAPFSLVILNQPLGHLVALRRIWENGNTNSPGI